MSEEAVENCIYFNLSKRSHKCDMGIVECFGTRKKYNLE